jgi:acyl-CoA dehydrogenase
MEAIMDFEHSPKVKALQQRLNDFMAEHIYPNEQRISTRYGAEIAGSLPLS